MKLTEQEFNKLCAEFMGLPNGVLELYKGNRKYSPFSNANDRDLVIEKMRLDIVFDITAYPDEWACALPHKSCNDHHKDRTTAINNCIEQVLLNWRKDNE